MQAEISKDFEFSASHILEGLPTTTSRSRLHGHNYRIRVTISGCPFLTGLGGLAVGALSGG